MQLVETRRKQLGREFFCAVMILFFVGVIVWVFYQTAVFRLPLSSQPGRSFANEAAAKERVCGENQPPGQ